MDTFFISHGSPTLAIDENLPARLFLQSWRSKIMQETPNAILIVSAHWDTDTPTVNLVHALNDTTYDFHDFPRDMCELKYPAPDLAKRVKELLDKSGFGPIKEEKNRRLDHGAWVPLMSMYPEPTVPVCQLSIQMKNNELHHCKMGEALAPLRDEGILVIGSGDAIHNLQAIGPDNGPVSK
ncbi:hypothetical protein LUZ60_015927 [Juncus effusus]|nr:hypothetical protein LUZ60_015927 [Juncus effusus]